ncbi:AAA domain-containing protein [Flavisolibacter tropicus]|uniref:DNA helicase n=1 Tax=Flavisolibacter tropicus TaxID=1492898 RepID=A0A172TZK9_9BACT|nr:AAA domain-containing protein [Flavisolibacter tropicus]ANE52539.1 DNA helicase [Flavisolibacter tropicus]
MDYFKRLKELLQLEKEEDRRSYEQLLHYTPVAERREVGMSWYPVAIRDTEIGRGDYLTVEIERTTHQDIVHQLRFGMTAALFSNHDAKNDRIEGTISYISGNRLKISLRVDDLPDWTRNGKLGVDAVFDENSYTEMEATLKLAPLVAEKKEEGHLTRLLTGTTKATFQPLETPYINNRLNASQQEAVQKILSANELAIVHGPPGTGKTTTLVQAIKALLQQDRQPILVVAPSNAAVDLLSEKLSKISLNVLRIGNPARVSEEQLSLSLDSKITAHPSFKEIKRLKKQAAEYRDMAQKYKRSFGPAEREQRKALYTEARNVQKEAERTEQYITEDLLSRAQVITATLVGANHYTIRHLRYHTVVIDEAGQALEPACWIPILKAKKLVMAGDHYQLPPTIKSEVAARSGLSETLMEKCVALHPEAVVLLEEQYRMNENIAGFPSREFYRSRLQAHVSVAHHILAPDEAPLVFIDTAGCGFEEAWEGTSVSNPEEAAFLIKHLSLLVSHLQPLFADAPFPSVGVISPYRHQVEVLKQAVASHPDLPNTITVNTIDSFQGQERDVIYISMVRSNVDNVIGFLSEVRRMNVAMTRARKKLIVIGDSSTLSQHAFYADFITYAQEKDAYKSAWEFMEW